MVMTKSATNTDDTTIQSAQRCSSSFRFQNHRPAASSANGTMAMPRLTMRWYDWNVTLAMVGGTSKSLMPVTVSAPLRKLSRPGIARPTVSPEPSSTQPKA